MDQAEDDDERQRGARHDREKDRQLVELARERRLLLLDLAQHPRDPTDLGRHPRCRDDHLAPTPCHGRVHVGHVDPVPERYLATGHRFDCLQDRSAFARQPGLLDLQRRGHEQATVRRDLVARLEDDDVARHELLGGDVHTLAVTPGMSPDDEHLLERGDALGRLALLVQAEDRVEHRQAEDHEAGGELLQGNDADDRGAEQDELHQVPVLAQERLPAGLLPRLLELVRADLLAALLDLGRLEPGCGSTSSCSHASSAVTPCHAVASLATSRPTVISVIPWGQGHPLESDSSTALDDSCSGTRPAELAQISDPFSAPLR